MPEDLLFLVAAGDTVDQVLRARETRVDRPIDTTDFSGSLETPESQAALWSWRVKTS